MPGLGRPTPSALARRDRQTRSGARPQAGCRALCLAIAAGQGRVDLRCQAAANRRPSQPAQVVGVVFDELADRPARVPAKVEGVARALDGLAAPRWRRRLPGCDEGCEPGPWAGWGRMALVAAGAVCWTHPSAPIARVGRSGSWRAPRGVGQGDVPRGRRGRRRMRPWCAWSIKLAGGGPAARRPDGRAVASGIRGGGRRGRRRSGSWVRRGGCVRLQPGHARR